MARIVKASIISIFIISILVILKMWLFDKNDEWKGNISRETGTIIVHNPKSPRHGINAISLREDLCIGGQNTNGYILSDITWVTTNHDGLIFVTDGKEKDVKVFDMNGNYLRNIGRAGQGPGEFSGFPTYIHCMNDKEILVVNGTRLSIFKFDGTHVKDINIAPFNLIDVCPDSTGDFFATLIARDEKGSRYELRKLDRELNTLIVLDTSPVQNTIRDGYNPFFPVLRWSPLSRGKSVSGYPIKYELKLFDAKGRLIRIIRKDANRIPISQTDVTERTAGEPSSSLKRLRIPEYFPFFRYLVTDNEDRIYVSTWERDMPENLYAFDVFDSQGRYLTRAYIPGLVPHIVNNRLYSIQKSEDGYPLLKRYKINWHFTK